jgi:hypothetical protein
MATRARLGAAGAAVACTLATVSLTTQHPQASVSTTAIVAATSLQPIPDTATTLHNPGMGLAVTFDDNRIPYGLTAAQYADPADPTEPTTSSAHSFWHESGITTILTSQQASILYIRTTWANLQPTSQSTYAWNDPASAVSKLVAQAKQYHLKVAFEVVTDSKDRTTSGGQATPSWFFTTHPSAVGNVEPTQFKDPIVSNPEFQTAYTAFVNAFGAQYNDPSLVSFVDGVGVGVGGDLLDLNQPATAPSDPATLHNLWSTFTGAYTHAFPKVPLTLNYVQNGAFSVADLNKTLADPNHHYVPRTDGLDIPNPNALKAFNTQWPAVPVVAESAFQDYEANKRWETYYKDSETALKHVIVDATSYHVNVLNLGLPAAVDKFVTTDKVTWYTYWWARNGGYRIAPTSVTLRRSLTRGKSVSISSTWSNNGMGVLSQTTLDCTTCLKYRVSYALLAPDTHKPVWTTLSDADPGALTGSKIQQTSDSRTIPASVAAGSYDLAVAIVDKSNGNAPAVQLGLSNPEYDASGTKITPGGFTAGWYQLGSISVR